MTAVQTAISTVASQAAAVGADALGGQSPIRVALGLLDPDDVGTPVGQQGPGHGHEHPLGQLDDPDPLARARIVGVGAVRAHGHPSTSIAPPGTPASR